MPASEFLDGHLYDNPPQAEWPTRAREPRHTHHNYEVQHPEDTEQLAGINHFVQDMLNERAAKIEQWLEDEVISKLPAFLGPFRPNEYPQLHEYDMPSGATLLVVVAGNQIIARAVVVMRGAVQ